MSISNLTEKGVNNVKEHAISDDLLQYDCLIEFDLLQVLASDTNRARLRFKENLFIVEILSFFHGKPVLNCTIKSFPLNFFD